MKDRKKMFPKYYENLNFEIPDKAYTTEPVEVYRACKSNKLDKESFSTFY